MANAIAGSLAAPLLAALSARILRRRILAMATGFAAALHPGLVSLSLDVESEALFLFLLLAAGFLLLTAVDRPSSNLAVGAGLAAALAALTRPTGLLLIPFLAAPLGDRRYPRRVRWQIAASALLGFLLTLSPWTVRNLLVFGELLPVNDAAGSAFYQGNSDWAVRFYEIRTRSEYADWSRGAFAELSRETAALDRAGVTSRSERSRYFFRKAIAERSQDPVGWMRLLGRKAWSFVRPYPNPLFWPAWIVVVVGVIGTAVTLLAIRGFLLGSGRPGIDAFAIAFLAATLAAHVALIVVWRYRIPYWDPLLLLYAAPGAFQFPRPRPEP